MTSHRQCQNFRVTIVEKTKSTFIVNKKFRICTIKNFSGFLKCANQRNLPSVN